MISSTIPSAKYSARRWQSIPELAGLELNR
jgi:hypothetical protein